MSPLTSQYTVTIVRFPRVSGDEPVPEKRPTRRCGFSPRERG